MSLTGLLKAVATQPAFIRLAESRVATAVAPTALAPVLLAQLCAPAPIGAGRRLLVVTATGREADDLAEVLRALVPEREVAVFPSWETLPHERLSPSLDTVGRRVAILRRLAHADAADPLIPPIDVLIASVRAVLQPMAAGLGDVEPVRITHGMSVDLIGLVERLVELGYERNDLVERRGQFAVRGGILDVFPPPDEHPLRVEFWGDVVEEIRTFSVADQRSLELAHHGLFAPPVRELLLTAKVRERARLLASSAPEISDVAARIAEGLHVEGMETLIPVLVDGMVSLPELIDPSSTLVLIEPERLRTRAHDLERTAAEFLAASWHNAAVGNQTPIDLAGASYLSVAEILDLTDARSMPRVLITPLASDVELLDARDDEVIDFGATAANSYRGDAGLAFTDIAKWAKASWRVVLASEGHGSAERFVESLSGEDIPARLVDSLDDEPKAGVVSVTTANMAHGFILAGCELAVLTETDIVGQRSSTKDMRRLPSSRRRTIDPLTLAKGDFVVHEQHGVGR
ncbi:MAG: transcription-repair coupling factor, partial [Actinobacteria bacterium]|nr:transcription-repair coupling factor [Actinomycetota bacterium]